MIIPHDKPLVLSAPLSTDWTAQYVHLAIADGVLGAPLRLLVDGVDTPFQYTGRSTPDGAEILLKIGFAKGERKSLSLAPCDGGGTTDLTRVELPLTDETAIGAPGCELRVGSVAPFFGFAASAMSSAITCEGVFEAGTLARTNDGPWFTDYELVYRYDAKRRYALALRCYKREGFIEVCESFSLGLNAELTWYLNPDNRFTHIVSRESFEGETQPGVEPLVAERPRDVLCRLQMPVLSEYFIPNNRGWFALYDERDTARGMVGILGLYGAKWEEPVENMPELFAREGRVEWHASLASGTRHWLLYAGPVEKRYQDRSDPSDRQRGSDAPDPRFVFHRLHAEFNALRLDEHLDLAGKGVFDTSGADQPGIFPAGDFHAAAQRRLAAYPCLQAIQSGADEVARNQGGLHPASFRYLLEPTKAHADALFDLLANRFHLWVRQFQGYRTGCNDYAKNVIGFSRALRGMLIAYEQLRRDGALDDHQTRRLNAYFAFAARRMLDEGRWPHSRTWRHPDHPESSRDFYTYGGEHKPDRLVWTNSLPNFQSDPLCALAHLAALFQDHPDAEFWRSFAIDEIERQLDAYCGESGAWEESINYALYTLSYLIITFRVLKYRCGIDYFNDRRVRRMVGWLCRFMGPRDPRFGVYTMPGVGNAVLPQLGQDYMLCYASEVADDDPLKHDCLTLWRCGEEYAQPGEHYPVVMAAMAPEKPPKQTKPIILRPLASELMDEVGVALRDRHAMPDESYLFQKIGFFKDHYENDESAFNWYAKGVPFCMDYGTYTGDVSPAHAHNLVEIPDMDALRRGYLADHLFSSALDYTRSEMPVGLKLLWGKVRTFAEVEAADGKVHRDQTPYYYIGDKNPLGPKVWKVRQLVFVKPDYVVLFDRVYGRVPHRYNLHLTGTDIQRQGPAISAKGRFALDLLAYVQHPLDFELETGELIPGCRGADKGDDANLKQAQHFFRLYNRHDGIYRTLLFARERERDVRIESIGAAGLKVATPEYTDYVFIHNDRIDETVGEVRFVGRVGWIRRETSGCVRACLPDGERIEAFGRRFVGRGPWSYNLDDKETIVLHDGPPRKIEIG